ncbi:MAG: protein kinase [Archangiaceae bacterium]|nr:protein kinase [Archangiaceae bacterium]
MADARERYVFIKKLAEGGMADVFLARDVMSTPPRLCVVKQLLPDLRSKKEHVGMFLDEADLAVRLAHPNVVRTIDRGTSRDGPFLVLEYLAGYDLDLVIERLRDVGGRMPWQLAVQIIISTAEGMAYAHALTGNDGKPLNLVHRDLTPSNIFLTFDGVVKVLDFGIARAEERRTRTSTGMLKGKARYLAPELIQQLPGDGRVDQFSLGAALYESLALRPLFSGENELAVIHAIIESRRPSLIDQRPDIPPEVDAVFRKMTARLREERFASMNEVARALKAVMPPEDQRPALSTFVRQQFGADFEAHAALMARLASASTSELRAYFEKGVNLTDALSDPSRLAKTQVVVNQQIPVEARRTPMAPVTLELPDEAPPAPRPPTPAQPKPLLSVTAEEPQHVPAAKPLRLPDELPLGVEGAGGAPDLVEEPPTGPRLWLVAVGLVVLVVVGALAVRAFSGKPPVVARGALLVRSQPPGASIQLDGVAVQFRTPAALPDLMPGQHTIVLEHPDTLGATTTALVVSGAQQTVDLVLPPKEGLLLFAISPPDAIVTVDGREVALDGGLGQSSPLDTGVHDVEIRAMGFMPKAMRFDIVDGARVPVELTLEPDPAAP